MPMMSTGAAACAPDQPVASPTAVRAQLAPPSVERHMAPSMFRLPVIKMGHASRPPVIEALQPSTTDAESISWLRLRETRHVSPSEDRYILPGSSLSGKWPRSQY